MRFTGKRLGLRNPIVGLKLAPRDLRVGVYWMATTHGLAIYVCPLPTLVIVIRERSRMVVT